MLSAWMRFKIVFRFFPLISIMNVVVGMVISILNERSRKMCVWNVSTLLFFVFLLLKMTLLLMINGNHLVEDNQFYLHSKDARMELNELDSSFAICILFKVFELEILGTFSLSSVLFLLFHLIKYNGLQNLSLSDTHSQLFHFLFWDFHFQRSDYVNLLKIHHHLALCDCNILTVYSNYHQWLWFHHCFHWWQCFLQYHLHFGC